MNEPVTGGLLPISDLIEEEVVRVSPEATLEAAADLLEEGQFGALVVGDGEQVQAIITERDLVHAIATRKDVALTKVSEVAHTKLIFCDITATVAEVAAEMMEHYVRHVLVEEDGRFVGIVSARDLLGAYTAAEMELD